MPGHDITPVNLQDLDRLRCFKCHLLLRKAQQDVESSERCCLSCVTDGYNADKAIDREVKKFLVKCTDCNEWKGDLESFYEEHTPICKQMIIDALRNKVEEYEKQNHAQTRSDEEVIKPFPYLNGPSDGDAVECVIPPANYATIKSEEIVSDMSIPSSKQSEFTWENKAPIADSEKDVDKAYEMAKAKATSLLQHEEEKDNDMEENEQKIRNLSQHLKCMTVKGLNLPFKTWFPYTNHFYNYSLGVRPHKSSGMQCCWVIENILSLVQEKAIGCRSMPIRSPPWFTDGGGYCMQAFLYPNGLMDYTNTHVSVFVSVRPGPNDDKLTWPAFGKISAFLTKDNVPWGKTVLVARDRGFPKPSPASHEFYSAGWFDFIPINELFSDRFLSEDNKISLEFSFIPLSY